MVNSDLLDFEQKVTHIQDLMTLVSDGKVEPQEKEAEYSELLSAIGKYLATHEIANPNRFSSLITFYGYFRSKLLTKEEKQNFVKKIYEQALKDAALRAVEVKPLVNDEQKNAETLFEQIIIHPQIKEVSTALFKTGNHRNAVLDAAIKLEEMVKMKANYPKDSKGKELYGVSLMHRVFDSTHPILSWCKSETQIGKDELEGYKLIFAGTVLGIRDPKAHAIFEISPMRSLKLLTLITVLAELVDASKLIQETLP